MDTKKRQKEAVFRELYSLDESESDGEACPLSVFCRRGKEKTDDESRSSKSHHALGCTVSAPAQSVMSSSSRNFDVTTKPSKEPVIARSSNTKASTVASKGMSPNKSFPAANASKYTPKTGKKRKRGRSVDVVPEYRRIFVDCAFCKNRPFHTLSSVRTHGS